MSQTLKAMRKRWWLGVLLAVAIVGLALNWPSWVANVLVGFILGGVLSEIDAIAESQEIIRQRLIQIERGDRS